MQKALLKQERKNKMVVTQKSLIQCKERSRKLEQQTVRAVDVFNYLINFASVFYGWVSIVSLGSFELLEAVTKRSRKKSLCSVQSSRPVSSLSAQITLKQATENIREGNTKWGTVSPASTDLKMPRTRRLTKRQGKCFSTISAGQLTIIEREILSPEMLKNW